jgi:hypothetical protein
MARDEIGRLHLNRSAILQYRIGLKSLGQAKISERPLLARLLTVSNREKQAQSRSVRACKQVKMPVVRKYAPAPIEQATHVAKK